MSSAAKPKVVTCPVCARSVPEQNINQHLDNDCQDDPPPSSSSGSQKSQTIHPLFSATKKPSRPKSPPPSRKPQTASSSKKRLHLPDSIPASSSSKRSKISSAFESAAPLAERLRPRSLEEFVGQPHLTGPNSLLLHLLDSGSTGSFIFWGPPGCGKTTLARLLAKRTNSILKELSATDSGISDVRAVVEEAKGALTLSGRRTILFLDEVHRFNKAQQDIFLPFLEQGQLQLIGATTENPSFKLTGALISRCRVFVLDRLTDDDIARIVEQAVERVTADPLLQSKTGPHVSGLSNPLPETETPSSQGLPEPSSSQSFSGTSLSISQESVPFSAFPRLTQKVLSSLVSLSNGDARTALSLVELVLSSPPTSSPEALLSSLRHSVSTSYDRTGESHYDMISALHKSVRGSQSSAALYWLARMLTAGEDPMYIARRMVVCASEDIGLADNHALPLAIATLQACQTIGMPECRINLAHLVSYLSEAPKSTRSYEGYNRAEAAAKLSPTAPVPLMVRNAPTKLMKELGYARGYHYNPEFAHPVTNDYLPPQFKDEMFLRKEGDMTDKIWDEDSLRLWELNENDGNPWEGRHSPPPHTHTLDHTHTEKRDV